MLLWLIEERPDSITMGRFDIWSLFLVDEFPEVENTHTHANEASETNNRVEVLKQLENEPSQPLTSRR